MCRILIVEDERDMPRLVEQFLAGAVGRYVQNGGKDFAFSVDHCETPDEAMTHVRDAELEGNPYSAVLLDLSFTASTPDQTLAWLEANYFDLPPVVVLTQLRGGHDPEHYRWRSIAAGAKGFFPKGVCLSDCYYFLLEVLTAIESRKAERKFMERSTNAAA